MSLQGSNEYFKVTHSSSTFAFKQHTDYACSIECYKPTIGWKLVVASLSAIILLAGLLVALSHHA